MTQVCWGIWEDRGFLINPDPIEDISTAESGLAPDASQQLQALADDLPQLIAERRVRSVLDDLPIFDLSPLEYAECRITERVFQIYSHLASAYIHAPGEEIVRKIPAGVAVPFVGLSEIVARPPILSYASYTLSNWQRIDPEGEIRVDNLRLLQKFIEKYDAEWFSLIHVEVEARAAAALQAIPRAAVAIEEHDNNTLVQSLEIIHDALVEMITTLKQMPQNCDPAVYYHEVRPYLFGFENVIYEGAAEYGEKLQSFRGGSGAQSSIVPALVRVLGVQHEQTGLTQHLNILRDYMPQSHRKLIVRIDENRMRAYVIENRSHVPLREAYNAALQRLLDFRQTHIRFAAAYIARQSVNAAGTAGTDYMRWLQQLIDETAAQMI